VQKQITPFFHAPTNSWSYLLADPASKVCAFIDPVLDFEPGAGTVQHDFITLMLNAAAEAGLQVAWVLETHIHADHVSAADFVRQQTGAQIGIGRGVEQVSALFTPIFNLGEHHPNVRVAFDRLFEPGETLFLGELAVTVLATPGHTPACVAYQVEDAVFVGDTLFMPDYGTARADFPGGDAQQLFESITQLLALPDATVLYLCHDYSTADRTAACHAVTVSDQRANLQLLDRDAAAFVAFRQARDAQLSAPRLLYPAIQINLAAGRLPNPEGNGQRYLKLPVRETA
jgi:glyoxylase-like metal-dependent hydrolase (beta-lactamase superfamily II)